MSPNPKNQYSEISKTIDSVLRLLGDGNEGKLFIFTDNLDFHKFVFDNEKYNDVELSFCFYPDDEKTYPIIIAYCESFPEYLKPFLEEPTNNLIWFRRKT